MTDVNRYRDGEMSSTTLMQRAMEEAHAVPSGEGQNVKWRADHESMDQARARIHDEPTRCGTIAFEAGAAAAPAGYVKREAKLGLKVLLDKASPGYLDASKQMGQANKAALGALAGPVAAGVVLFAAAVAETTHAMSQGDELRADSDVDAMDVAVTNLLDLDPAFKQHEWAKFPSISPESTMRHFTDSYGNPTTFGREHIPELQAAADAGSRAALDAMKCGGREAYFAAHPASKERLANDVAFNKGFENVMFLAGRREDEKVRAIETTIDARNASASIAVPVRG